MEHDGTAAKQDDIVEYDGTAAEQVDTVEHDGTAAEQDDTDTVEHDSTFPEVILDFVYQLPTSSGRMPCLMKLSVFPKAWFMKFTSENILCTKMP